MTEERVTERTDGTTTERITETGSPTTTVVERRGGGGGMLIGLAILLAVIVGAYFLLNADRNDTVQTEAVTDAAQKVGDSAEKAADSLTK